MVVTGAAGGVGSVAIVAAGQGGWTRDRLDRPSPRGGLSAGARRGPKSSTARRFRRRASPFGKERWAAGVDSVGSHTLANVLAQTRYGGAVAACGLAGGMDLPARSRRSSCAACSLLGVDSVNCPMPRRVEAWSRLARDLDRDKLARDDRDHPARRGLRSGRADPAGKVRGRIVVEIE